MDKKDYNNIVKMFNQASTTSSSIIKNRSTTIAMHPSSFNSKKGNDNKFIKKKDENSKNINKNITKNDENSKNDNKKNEISQPINQNCLLKRASKIIDEIPEKEEFYLNPDDEAWTDLELDSFSQYLYNANIENFDETKYPNRKYNFDNIKFGKKFFKLRFIKKKLKEKKSKSNNSKELTISNLDNERNSRLYNSDFLLICEKAILSFNHKNYQESYDILSSSGIITSIFEFGEFLLVVSGFDKILIGEFLAKKKKPPNDKGEVLDSFIKHINMEHNNNTLLDCVRLLLSRINLPKDANLILVIMESFCKIFYEVNKSIEEFVNIFKNSDNIYLLVSTLLALNTMFTRKDIKNMNAIKIDEFINMNNKVKEDYLTKLYNQLKNKPITLSDDYNESIYQKLTPLVAEKTNKLDTNKKSLSNNETRESKKNLDNLDNFDFFDERRETNIKIDDAKINFDTFTKDDEDLLHSINKFYKISGAKSPNLYNIIVNEDCSKLHWDKNLDITKTKKINCINIIDINEIYNGIDVAEHSNHIKKYIKAFPNEEKLCNTFICISYNNNKETLDLKCDNIEITLKWFKALKSLVNKVHNEELKKKENKNDEEQKERENNIADIWEKNIQQKWDKYGNYLILKIQEKSNFFNYIINDQKQSTKNELLLDDKKYNNRKFINTFLENIKTNKKDIEVNEFFFLCNLGFPSKLRKKLWKIIIGNPYYISENTYNSIQKQIEQNLNFDVLEKKYNNNKNISLNKDSNINKIIIDIIIIKKFFINDIIEQKIDEYGLMLSVYKVTRAFFLFRKDIPYNKNFIDIAYFFFLVENKEENVFMNILNFLSNNNFIKLFLGNEELRKDMTSKNISLFNKLIKNRLPNIEGHFSELEIIPELYFVPWMDDLYIKTLNLKILLPVFDLYLLNGEYILFQTGLAILKILEDELMNMTISQVLNLLKRLPDKYKKEKFFEIFNSLNNIKSDYVEWKKQNEINSQKNILIS